MFVMGSIWTIRRSATDAKLAGVCGGVARHWGVDPVLVRVGWALLALSGGIGLVLYLAGWLLVPVDGKQTSTLDDILGPQTRAWPREAWLALVVVICVISFVLSSPLMPFGLGPAAVLALIWYFGYYKNRTPAPPEPPSAPLVASPPAEPFRYPGPATPFTEAAEVWQRRMSEYHRQTTAAPAPGWQQEMSTTAVPSAPVAAWPTMPTTASDPALADPPTAEDREHAAFLAVPDPVGLYADHHGASALPTRLTQARSVPARRLRLLGVLVLGLVLAGLAVADRMGADISVTGYLAASLLVIGLTLIAATWLGRARGILPIGVLVLLALLSVSLAAPYGDPRTWSREETYTQLSQLPTDGDQHRIGVLDVDLSRLEVDRDATYRAHLGTGSLQVTVPQDTQVEVRYQVDQGVVVLNGATTGSGPDLRGETPLGTAAGEDQPLLTLDLSVDHGEVRVQR
jgi:phage shock protein PspC (stress-responsive transcriptional regulator)